MRHCHAHSVETERVLDTQGALCATRLHQDFQMGCQSLRLRSLSHLRLLQLEGLENLPAFDEPAVYIANHQSFLVRCCLSVTCTPHVDEWQCEHTCVSRSFSPLQSPWP